MGTCFNSIVWDGKLSPDEVKDKYSELIEELYASDGRDSYNGTFTTCSGLSILDTEFNSQNEAQQWLISNTHKCDNVLAVRFLPTVETLIKQPTFDGGTRCGDFDSRYSFLKLTEAAGSDIAVQELRCCLTNAMSDRVDSSQFYDVFPADQLTWTQREHLDSHVRSYVEARVQHVKLQLNFSLQLQDLRDFTKVITSNQWKNFKELRISLRSNLTKRTRLANKLARLEARYADLWETMQTKGEPQWLLGGKCSI
jgi:hypothetical protein